MSDYRKKVEERAEGNIVQLEHETRLAKEILWKLRQTDSDDYTYTEQQIYEICMTVCDAFGVAKSRRNF